MSEKKAKRKARKCLSTAAKVAALDRLARKEITQVQLSVELDVDQGTISHWLQQEEALRAALEDGKGSKQTLRAPEYPLVEQAVVDFIELLEQADAAAPKATTWSLLQVRAQTKANALVAAGHDAYKNFKASTGWLSNVMKRAGIKRIALHGIAGDVSEEQSEQAMQGFRASMAELNITNLHAIFNADETALFYK